MSEFSARDAAFEGFRIARERPAAMALWAFAWLVMALITGVCVVKFGGKAFADFMALAQQPSAQPDLKHLFQVYADLAPFAAVMLPITLVFYSIMMTAAYRLVLDHHSRLGLHLGMDELRQVGLMIILTLGFFVAYVLLGTVAGLVVGLAALISSSLGIFMIGVGLLGMCAALIYLSVRFSLAGPQTFAAKKLTLMGSWALTRGHFWPILGAYALSLVFAAVVALLGGLLVGGVFALGGAGFANQLKIDANSLSAYFTPVRIVSLAASSILSALTWAIAISPSVVIYRRLAGSPTVETF